MADADTDAETDDDVEVKTRSWDVEALAGFAFSEEENCVKIYVELRGQALDAAAIAIEHTARTARLLLPLDPPKRLDLRGEAPGPRFKRDIRAVTARTRKDKLIVKVQLVDAPAAPRAETNPLFERFARGKQLKKWQRKDRMLFIPRRCEWRGCGEEGALKRCAKCEMVMYCSAAHQKADWKRHKRECAHLAGLGLWGCAFDESREFKKFPSFDREPPAEARVCGICGLTEPLRRTECCGMWICDRERDYQMFSFSRDFCSRSHNRYTSCAFHKNESHGDGDWRDCEPCRALAHTGDASSSVRSWYSTNGYNFTPGRASEYPQGSFITAECSGCGGRVACGFEGHSTVGRSLLCSACTGAHQQRMMDQLKDNPPSSPDQLPFAHVVYPPGTGPGNGASPFGT